VKDVALGNMGPNPLHLEVKNADGEATREEVVRLRYDIGARKAQIELRSPPRVDESRYRLDLRVHSQSKLRRIDLKKPSDTRSRPLDVSGQKEDGQGRFYEFTTTVTLDLREGPNLLAIDAENDGGVETHEATITYIPRPVRLLIEPPDEVAKTDTLALTGRIVWTDARRYEDIETHLRQLRVFVNGFRQGAPTRPRVTGPTTGRRTGARELAFTVSTILNRSENHIQVEVPGLPLEDGGRQLFKVACRSRARRHAPRNCGQCRRAPGWRGKVGGADAGRSAPPGTVPRGGPLPVRGREDCAVDGIREASADTVPPRPGSA
jgi:hypothetical protein